MVSVGDAITFMYKSKKYLGVITQLSGDQRLRVKIGGIGSEQFVSAELKDIIGFEYLTVAEKDNEITLQRDNEITSQRAEKHKELASLRAELRATDKEMALLMAELQADLPAEDKEMALLMAELQADLHAKNKELASLIAELQSKKDKELASLRAELQSKKDKELASLRAELQSKKDKDLITCWWYSARVVPI